MDDFVDKFDQQFAERRRTTTPLRVQQAKVKSKLEVTWYCDIDPEPQKEWLVDNFLGEGELSCFYGPPGSAKSLLVGDLAAHVAWGQNWFGHRASEGGVLFLAVERAGLVFRRFAAFRKHHSVPNLPLLIAPGEIDLRTGRRGADTVISYAKQMEQQTGLPTKLIVGDTASRLLAGGDENSPKEMGSFINNVAYIQQETSSHIALVHHVPHEQQKRMRGHGSLLAACDTTICVEGSGGTRFATIVKNNDGDEGKQIAFKLAGVELGRDPETDAATTAPVVVTAVGNINKSAPEQRLRPNQSTMYAILRDAAASGLTTEQWNERARNAGIGAKRKADLYDIRTALKAKGIVRQYGDRWNAC
jgi:hypothetical protein